MKYKHKIKNPEMIGKELKRVADELASCDVSILQTTRIPTLSRFSFRADSGVTGNSFPT